MTYDEMVKNYNSTNFAKAFLLGFVYKKRLYVCTTNTVNWKLAKASDGSNQLRFAPDTDECFDMVINGNSHKLMLAKEFDELEGYANKGQKFEQIICQLYEQNGKANSVPYWKAGDIVIDGIHYQIKFQNGTVSEKSIASAMNELGL